MNRFPSDLFPSGSNDAPPTGSDFVSRWEKRKQRVQEEAQGSTEVSKLQEETAPAASVSEANTEPTEGSSTEAVVELTDADMPPIDSLHEDSDFSGFMSPKVSEDLRRLALRKLFQGASFNVCDGLDDYDEDFTYFEKLGDIVTADMWHQWQVEARKWAQDNPGLSDAQQAANPHTEPQPHDEVEQSADEAPAQTADSNTSDAALAASPAQSTTPLAQAPRQPLAEDAGLSPQSDPTKEPNDA